MIVTNTRRLQFAAGHRVHGHESKCAHLHGHNYVVHLTAHGQLDHLGRVIDFSVLKDLFGRWIDENWDHGFIVWAGDWEARRAMESVVNQKVFLLDLNPTAENMADYLLREIGPKLLQQTGIRLVHVRLEETENCTAEASLLHEIEYATHQRDLLLTPR